MRHLKQLQQCISELDLIEQQAKEQQTCLRKAVGCSICAIKAPDVVDDVGIRRLAFQHNGPARSGNPCTNIVGNCGCSHAEPRVIMSVLKMPRLPIREKLVLFCTYSPCTYCANVIIDSGLVSGLVYDILTEHDTRGLAFLKSVMPCVTREEIEVASRESVKPPAQQLKEDIVERVNAAFGRWHSNS